MTALGEKDQTQSPQTQRLTPQERSRLFKPATQQASKVSQQRVDLLPAVKTVCACLLLCGLLISGFRPLLAASAACLDCHQDQVAAWSDSDHAWAMRTPLAAFVKAPFQGEAIAFDGLEGVFERRDRVNPEASLVSPPVLGSPDGVGPTEFLIRLRDRKAGALDFESFTVRYTFGHEPLQQYLIALAQDRLQVAPFAYDTRPASVGGQRWIHLESFAGPHRVPRFDWQQPLQNWNGMCADCHSRGFERDYDPETHRFNSSFGAINVDCLACHNPSDRHGENSAPSKAKAGGWVRAANERIAHWQGAARDPATLDTCFACHSLRAPLTDGFHPDTPFLDQFRPEPVLPPFYQADGQIEEEVYVYGSFLQSKMYQAGVQCQDCHDPHTAEVKVKGNGLCLTCHQATAFATPQHHGHALGGKAAQCVTCHMPGKTYMGIDFRRDHRFGVPNTPMSQALNTRDVCQSCHEDRWAAFLDGPQFKRGPATGAQAMAEQSPNTGGVVLAANADASALVLAMLSDASTPAINKAAQLKTLPEPALRSAAQWLNAALRHPEPLVRLSAVEVASALNAPVDSGVTQGLLNDPVRAVRLAALPLWRGADPMASEGTQIDLAALKAMQAAADLALRQIAWRGEGRLQAADHLMMTDDWPGAVAELQAAIAQDPYFLGGYLNLADVRRQQGRDPEALAVLGLGLDRLPTSAMLYYSAGLTHIRLKDYQAAQPFLEKASEIAPARVDFFYTYLALLDALGKRSEALDRIKARYPTGARPPQIDQLQKNWQRGQ